jgi:hypothetical protein
MIKHIVMWTILPGDTPRSKVERMAELKARLVALNDIISEIVNLEVHFNSPQAATENFDVLLTAEFKTWADLENYRNHPEHLKVVDYLQNIRHSKAALDFEY